MTSITQRPKKLSEVASRRTCPLTSGKYMAVMLRPYHYEHVTHHHEAPHVMSVSMAIRARYTDPKSENKRLR